MSTSVTSRHCVYAPTTTTTTTTNTPRAHTSRHIVQPPARVLVCETTDHYRAAAQAYCHPGDVVLEVGCSHGEL